MANTFRNKKAEEGLDEERRAAAEPEQERQEPASDASDAPDAPATAATDNGGAAPARKGRRRNMAGSIFGGDFLAKEWVRRQRWLLLMVVAFCLVLVSNRYVVEHLMRDKLETEEQIKYLRERRIQMKQDYQENVKISHIAGKLDSTGVGLIAGPPYELEESKEK